MSEELNGNGQLPEDAPIHDVIPVSGMYENWFLDYASYVILERAVPGIGDGFKPVQRRIMHALKEVDDGRFNKVANVIGNTMQYHPHGDASIGDAIVNIGQKELLFDTQGNWGDVRTGDSAAAPRYIEVRLSKFANEVVFNPQTTNWQLSYDGRKKEPVSLPVKFPLLLALGVEGIAVGLSTKILPHNFCELIKASIDVLKGKKPKIYPDFATGGMADFSEYNQGLKGRIRVRARMEVVDKKTLIIKEIPFGTTTTGLIESIVKANDKGKLKIKQVVDNTAQDVEIAITVAPGQSPDIVMDALYAFTDCEVSINPNACVVIDDKPKFLKVNDILKLNTEQTVALLTLELEIRKAELLEKILFSSLEKIFIENRIYRDIEECETWEAVISTIDDGLKPFKKQFYRKITEEDIVRLTEIKIKRISKFDSFKADELMKKLEEELKEVKKNLANITDYAINYFQNLLEKYGEGRERKTEIKSFDTISVQVVAANNQKLYVNRKEGFVGYGLKKDEFIGECSDLDTIVAIRKDGKCIVSKVAEKVFMGKDIMYAGVWKKNDERMVYNAVTVDGKTGRAMVKRFQILAVTRDKEYDLSKGHPGSKLLYVSANPNGEAETITVKLTAGSKARKKVFDFDFSTLEVKGRGAGGNILTKYPVRRIELKSEGVSTLSGLDIWYDETVGRLNRDGRGQNIGNFHGDDKILAVYKDGSYQINSSELSTRFEPEKVVLIRKFVAEQPLTAVHYDGESKNYLVKRFLIETTTQDKKFGFISESPGSKLIVASLSNNPVVEINLIKGKGKNKETAEIDLSAVVDVKGWKALGNRLSNYRITKVTLLSDEGESQNVAEQVVEAETNQNETVTSEVSENAETNDTEKTDQVEQAKEEQKKSKPTKETKPKSKPVRTVSEKQATAKGSVKKPSKKTAKSAGDSKQEKLFKESDQKPKKSGGAGFDVGDTIELDF